MLEARRDVMLYILQKKQLGTCTKRDIVTVLLEIIKFMLTKIAICAFSIPTSSDTVTPREACNCDARRAKVSTTFQKQKYELVRR